MMLRASIRKYRDWVVRRAPGFLRESGWVLLMFVASRLLILAVVLFSKSVLSPGECGHDFGQPAHAGHAMRVFTQWDGAWYRVIAEHGYTSAMNPRGDPVFNAVFFPVYPMLVRGAAFIIHDYRLASVVTSNVCLLIAALLFNSLIKLDYKDPSVRRAAITFLMFSPVSFFFSSAYTESTFLLLAIGAFFAAKKQKWLLACLCGMCVAATRPPGFLIGIPLFVEYVAQTWQRQAGWKSLLHPQIFLFALVPLGLGLYMLACYKNFGDPIAFVHMEKMGWYRSLTPPWRTFLDPQGWSLFYRFLYQTPVLLAGVLLLIAVYFRMRPSYLVFVALMILFYLSWGSIEAMPRFLSTAFPLFIIVGLIVQRFEWTYEPLLASSVALLTFCCALTSNSYWMT